MKKITMKELINSTNIPERLVRAVVRQSGGWESFTQNAPDIARHGVDGGFHGWIYHSETEPFARKNRNAIAELAAAQAEDFGMGVIEMIKGFGCLKSSKPTDSEIGMALYSGKNLPNGVNVLNALAWYAAEEVSRAYADMLESDRN